MRPVLLLATYDLFPKNTGDPMPAACALEFIHTYSLIHDDLPAMDNDDFRRGKPTSHKKFGDAMAILAGDGLLTEAFRLMTHAYRNTGNIDYLSVIDEIASAAGSGGMVGGQVLDTVSTGYRITQEHLEHLHSMKTGALIRAAVRCGAIIGKANKDQLTALTNYGECIGLAFQVADDILDVVGTREELGKSVGKDAAYNKTTYTTLLGVEGSRDYAFKLADKAKSELKGFGESSGDLCELAEFIVSRTA